ncbi:MAG: non-canonical purine NTP pyrophosphatase [Acidimicrobiia bacterium]|nr:MAG: non-canonical purine NTP pyrophosphatase [Acidimicrobiia bacterium]
MIPRLVVASKNPDKIAEVEDILMGQGLVGELVRGLTWADVPETGATLEENALLKARAVSRETGLPALADDTGLEVVALGGRPGVYSARYAGEDATYADNVSKLLAEMAAAVDRRARFRTVVALVEPSGETWTAEGVLAGEITREPRGDGGFGYDPVFEVEGRTLAELTPEEKNRISHRARALRALAERLSKDSPDGGEPLSER